jgi:hypothetical protein
MFLTSLARLASQLFTQTTPFIFSCVFGGISPNRRPKGIMLRELPQLFYVPMFPWKYFFHRSFPNLICSHVPMEYFFCESSPNFLFSWKYFFSTKWERNKEIKKRVHEAWLQWQIPFFYLVIQLSSKLFLPTNSLNEISTHSLLHNRCMCMWCVVVTRRREGIRLNLAQKPVFKCSFATLLPINW